MLAVRVPSRCFFRRQLSGLLLDVIGIGVEPKQGEEAVFTYQEYAIRSILAALSRRFYIPAFQVSHKRQIKEFNLDDLV